jgi:tagatose-6-phosphate ketose/aldose isomerase
LVLASRFLGFLDRPDEYREIVDRLGKIARALLLDYADILAEVAQDDFRYAVFLGAGCRHGAAREAGLKLMEMSAGRVRVMAETYLGLRHGPMAAIHEDTLIVCFLSADPHARAYEMDLIRELNRKGLGRRKVIIGEGIARELLRTRDVAIECPGLNDAGDKNVPVIDVLAGQLLAFHHCLATGLRPDSPSPEGVISRVVGSFRIHRRMTIEG